MKLLKLFYEHVNTEPDKVVYEDSRRTLTNRELDELSARVYRYLQQQHIGTEDVVALRLPRSVWVPAVLLGVIKAGAAFVVIGEKAGQHAEYFLQDSGAKLLFTPEILTEALRCEPLAGYREAQPHDLACIVYSSGSSGYFKGSMHEYGQYDRMCARIHMFAAYEAEYGALSHERTAMVHGFYGIDGVLQVLSQLATGSYVDIVPSGVPEDPERFHRELAEKHITTTTLSPAHLQDPELLKGTKLEYAYVAYEMFGELYSPDLTLYNCYGLTEAFLDLCCFSIDRPYDITPVGTPHPDITLMLADDEGNPVTQGKIGEVWVKSEFFRGYRNREQETAQALVNGYLRTGDMAMVDKNGNYVVLGRKMDLPNTPEGFIIPQQIAAAICKKLGISWCYVKCFAHSPRPVICAYFTADPGITVAVLREKLKDHVPSYMLPTHLQVLDHVERFTSGKTNRYAFRDPTVEE